MQRSKIKVGRYYLVNLSIEIGNLHTCDNYIGKLIEINTYTNFEYSNRKQIYFFEFLESHANLHSGLKISKKIGKANCCYFISNESIIKEVPLAEIVAHEL